MWRFGPGAESPREIEALFERLAGPSAAAEFWERFRDVFVAEADIARIAASGFDHVRLPINARVIQDDDGEPVEAGYALIDRLLRWCREHRLWVLLDLHGAPGGQTGTNIDDSPNGLPELFMDDRYRRRTLRLWRDLAARYAGDTTVLGYDLLNEPLPNEWQHTYRDELVRLYRDLTAEIRAVDPDHLIVYEGSHWATNWEIFTEVWDDNSLLQFHKYWSSPDRPSIAPYLETRERLGLPIYMGEGGENTADWIYTAHRLYEAHGIGWNFWPWKKIDTPTSPASVRPPAGWDRVVASAAGGSPLLGRAEAGVVLDRLVEAMRLENCEWRPEIVAALTAASPSTLPAWGFGFRGAGRSYRASGSPLERIRADDAVTLRFHVPADDPEQPFEHPGGRTETDGDRIVVDLAPGEWLEYELDPAPDLSRVRVLGPSGSPAPVVVKTAPRGLRVVATAPATLWRIELGGSSTVVWP
ncbi:endoglucanase [Jiangella anatolica]|uniref:Endoglucanase n=2 Tax=Jiangella anatolica TaxID=2670374 RepID=A0A2W2CIV1_9ACTN|nr:endoglucanase [Jiangella anatolica]